MLSTLHGLEINCSLSSLRPLLHVHVIVINLTRLCKYHEFIPTCIYLDESRLHLMSDLFQSESFGFVLISFSMFEHLSSTWETDAIRNRFGSGCREI